MTIPSGWRKTTLGEFIALQRGHDLPAQKRHVGDIPVIGAGGINGWHNTANVTGPGVVLGRSGAGFGNAHYCPGDFWAHNTALYVTDFHGNDPQFAYYLLDYLNFTPFNSGGAQPSLNRNFISPIEITVPPLAEQQHIAALIALWDKAVGKLAEEISERETFRLALCQQLLTGKRRFPAFNAPWRQITLGDYLSESRIPGTHGKIAKKITVKLYGLGAHAKEEKRSGSENTKYYIRRAGQFIYSKLDFLNGAFGIIPDALDGYESTLDLPCFDIKPGLNGKFLLNIVTRKPFYSKFIDSATGGRKARRVNPAEFLAERIMIPEPDEQQRIVHTIDLADTELNLKRQSLNLLKQQRKAIAQQLITGKLRR